MYPDVSRCRTNKELQRSGGACWCPDPLSCQILGRGPSPRRARRKAGARPRSAASPEVSAAGVCAGAGLKTPTAQPRLKGSSAPLGRPPSRAKPPPPLARPCARARPASSAAAAAPAPTLSRRGRRRRAQHVSALVPSTLGRAANPSSASLRRLQMTQQATVRPARCGKCWGFVGGVPTWIQAEPPSCGCATIGLPNPNETIRTIRISNGCTSHTD